MRNANTILDIHQKRGLRRTSPVKFTGEPECVASLERASLSQKGGSRTDLPGSTDLPETGNGVGGPEHVSKAEDEEASRAVALRDPRGMVRATLLEVQPWLVHSRPVATLAKATPPCATEPSGAGKRP